jgi:hypothetical protein
MTFLSTYSGGSIRGWQSTTTVTTFEETQNLLPNPNIADSRQFGSFVNMSLDNNYLLVSQRGSNSAARTTIYQYNSSNLYQPQHEVLANTNTVMACATNYDGSTAIFGDSDSTPTGEVFVYDRSGNTWTLQANILPATGTSFGLTLDMNYWGNMVAIGDRGANTANTNVVYTYYRSGNTWSLGQTITNPTGRPAFGDNIAISKDPDANYIAIKTATSSGITGKVCVYNKTGNTTYSLQQIIDAPSGVTDSWPSSISINDPGDVLAVGDIERASFLPGSVWIYKRTGNTWATTFPPVQPIIRNNRDNFGESVKLNGTGELLLVSDPSYPIVGTTPSNQGIVYVFTQTATSYAQVQSISPNSTSNNSFYGESIACGTSGSIFAVGERQPLVPAPSGEVFIYTAIA